MLIGIACLAYLSVSLGDLGLFHGSDYTVYARFSTVAGLKNHAAVTMAGVEIGQVVGIGLEQGEARVTIRLDKNIRLEEDAIASIKTMGIIGDKYVAISHGGADEIIEPGGRIRETQPPLDIEALAAKFVFGTVEE